MKTIWSQEETEFLRENYAKLKTKELLSVLSNKTNDQLRWKAKDLKVKKEVSQSKSDLRFLENLDDPESCYWWGFLTADGCFTPKQIIFSLEEKDKHQVKLFAKKCQSKVSKVFRVNDYNPKGSTMYRTAACDGVTSKKLIERFKITPKKTYNPFCIKEFLQSHRLIHFLVGFIDGDGYICNTNGNYLIAIKLHPNWEQELLLLSTSLKELYNIDSYVEKNKSGWVILKITKKKNLSNLKQLINPLLPILQRKWIKVSLVQKHQIA